MNNLRDKAGTYPLLSVNTSVAHAKGEVFLTTKSNTVGLGVRGIFPSRDDCSLLLGAELHREIATREMSGKVQAARPGGTIH